MVHWTADFVACTGKAFSRLLSVSDLPLVLRQVAAIHLFRQGEIQESCCRCSTYYEIVGSAKTSAGTLPGHGVSNSG